MPNKPKPPTIPIFGVYPIPMRWGWTYKLPFGIVEVLPPGVEGNGVGIYQAKWHIGATALITCYGNTADEAAGRVARKLAAWKKGFAKC